MKTLYGTILVLVIAVGVLLSGPSQCLARQEKENFWSDDEQGRAHRWFELTDEGIEKIMERLTKKNPKKAKELSELREKDPKEFKAELRKLVREKFRKKYHKQKGFRRDKGCYKGYKSKDQCEQFCKNFKECQKRGRFSDDRPKHKRGRGRGEHGPGGPHRGPGRDGPHGGHGGGGGFGSRARHAEYLEWLEENHPEKAKELAELKGKKPELYAKKLGRSFRRRGSIAEAAKRNPELAKVLGEDLVLKDIRNKLLREYHHRATDKAAKKKAVEKLEEIVSGRFDLIVKRKQIEYDHLRKRLERIQKRAGQSQANVEKWKDVKFKEENVKARLKELTSSSEKFTWE